MFTLHLNLNDLYDKRDEGIKGKFVPIFPTFKPRVRKRGFCILTSSNGLLCVHVCETDNLFLWNPTTNESRLIPLPNNMNWFNKKYCGAGYVSSTDDYKIVLVGTYSRDYYGEPLQAKVYSLRENRWRTINCIPSNQYVFDKSIKLLCKDPILLSNALHWVVATRKGKDYIYWSNVYDRHSSLFVIKFDLAKEVFRRTGKIKVKRKEEAIGSFGDYNCSLGVTIRENDNNHLCICDMYRRHGKPDVVEMWVLDERDYILKKKFRVEGTQGRLGNDHRLLRITGNGEVVIFEKKKVYFDEKRLFESLRVFDARQPGKSFSIRVSNEYFLPYQSGVPVSKVVDFVPTLLSPNYHDMSKSLVIPVTKDMA